MKNIHKAIKLPLIYLTAFVCLAPGASLRADLVESSPEQKALEVFGPFFNDPNHQVTESFYSMCCKAIPHLSKSKDPELVKLAEVLTKVCTKDNIMVIGNALIKYANTIKKYCGNMVNPSILKDRLTKALTIKK